MCHLLSVVRLQYFCPVCSPLNQNWHTPLESPKLKAAREGGPGTKTPMINQCILHKFSDRQRTPQDVDRYQSFVSVFILDYAYCCPTTKQHQHAARLLPPCFRTFITLYAVDGLYAWQVKQHTRKTMMTVIMASSRMMMMITHLMRTRSVDPLQRLGVRGSKLIIEDPAQ